MNERRKGSRRRVDVPVTKQMGSVSRDCWTSDIGPAGVRLVRFREPDLGDEVVDLEIHLVPGGITTVITARRVWHDESHEAYEFLSPSFAQQVMLERIFGNI